MGEQLVARTHEIRDVSHAEHSCYSIYTAQLGQTANRRPLYSTLFSDYDVQLI